MRNNSAMPRAHLLIRHEPLYRRDAFEAGLKECGYTLAGEPRDPPHRDDILVIWNRYGRNHAHATRFEQAGARVVIAENGALGRDWLGDHWYSITLSKPLAAGAWPEGPADRWESFGQPLCAWRKGGHECIVLAQRGIGPPDVAQPSGWHQSTARALKSMHWLARIREHPGERPATPLSVDLQHALMVVTWASGAALKALAWGIPVVYGLHAWIGAECGLPLATFQGDLRRPDRSPFFHRLAWAIWRTSEISRGEPFRRLLLT
jgi:hypothetical protein